MFDDESFIEESDGDGTPPQWRKNKDQRKTTTIPDSDEEFDDEVPEGRMTPSIKRAIRRSILNISRVADSDEEEQNEEEEEEDDEEIDNGDESHERSNKIEISDSDSEDFIPTQKRRGNRISDSSEDEDLLEKSSRHPPNPRKSLLKFSSSFNSVSDESSENQGKTPRKSTSQHITSLLDSTEDEEEKIPDSGLGSNPKTSKHTPGSDQRTPSFYADHSHPNSGSQHSTMKKSNSSRQSESLNIENSSSDEEESPPPKLQPKSVPKKPQIRPEFIISSDEDSQPSTSKTISKPSEIISLDSDTPSDNPSDSEPHSKSIGESAAMSFAQQELDGLKNLDPILAQRRALLAIELQKRELELSKIQQFLASGKQYLLPDKGQKLLEKSAENEEAIKDLREKIAKCRLVEPNVSGEDLESSRDVSVVHEDDSLAHSPGSVHDNSIKVVGGARRDPDYMPYASEEDTPKAKPSAFNNGILNRPTTAQIGELGKKARETFEREQALTVETLKSFHGSLHSCPAEDEQAEDPKGLKVPLMGHQKHALAWLLWREGQKPPGGVLADDMGLGKTLTMISLVLKSMETEDSGGESEEEWYSKQKSSKPAGGTLVVCPASLIGQWELEVKRRCKRGLLNVELYHGNKRENVPKRLARNDMVITTYNLLSREHKMNQVLFRIKWKRVILDEGHVIRNHKSQVCEAVCALEAHKRWVLTGTPIHNKEMDLFSVLKFLQCAPFNDIRVWKRWVDNKNSAGHERLATVMKTLLLRRTKQELMSSGAVENLPEKSFEVKWVQLDQEERLVYEKVMLYSKTIFAQFLHQRAEKEQMLQMGAGYYERPTSVNANPFNKAQQRLLAQHAPPDDVKSHKILELFLRLRQICCHPSLIHAMLDKEEYEQTGLDDDEMDMTQRMGQMKIGGFGGDEEVPDGPAEVDERVAEHLLTSDNPVFERSRESSKLRAVLELLEDILEKGEKVIIVSQWTSVLDIIAENLNNIEGATFKSLTGAVQVKDRGALVDSFNHDRDPKILLLSLTAGGVGLNLVGANHLILVDIHWNPQLESQAQDRIYRFGQKKNVFIYKFLCTDTIEEKIKTMQDHKLELANSVLSGSGKGQSVKLTMEDLRSIFEL